MKSLIYPCKTIAQNSDRSVGFEFEYSNLEIEDTANIIAKNYGGEIKIINPYNYKIYTSIGTFKVLMDFGFLSNSKLKELNKEIGLEIDEDTIEKIEEIIAQIGKSLVPYELTTPPLKFTQINEAHNIKELLRKNGAQGTRANLLYAFGMHINPEARELNIETILSDLRAFFILYNFIRDTLDIDITRRLTTYIDPFDTAYILKVLDFDYRPTMSEFIDDYIAYNPTRNRALDLLPLLTFIDESRVREKLPDEKIGKRPTYHYRLPDSRVDETAWSPCFAWNSWVLIETLSADIENQNRLADLMYKYIETPWNLLQRDKFEQEVNEWVQKSIKYL
ncbi:MAG: hypothetical protein GXO60_07580 [Epsilonproteobacteria bacterium]|nr:hypothetical protein [Campylobacterota bacterium]